MAANLETVENRKNHKNGLCAMGGHGLLIQAHFENKTRGLCALSSINDTHLAP